MKLVKSIVFYARFRENMPAIAFPGGIATYGALMKAVGAAVDAIRIFDLVPGTPVMLDIRNPIHHTAMMFALALLGLPSSSVGTSFVAEKAGFLPKLFLTDRDDAKSAGIRQIRVDDRWFATDASAQPDYGRLLSLPGFTHPQDIVRYVYSSGTTGHPKCVALTQECLELRLHNARMGTGWWMNGPAALNMMGFSTIAGTIIPLTAHANGMLLCYAGSSAEALQMINVFGVTGLVLSVGQLQPFFNLLGSQPPPRGLRFLAIAGARITRQQLTEARARICNVVLLGYGSTEMGALTSGISTTLEEPDGFAGYVFPWVAVEAVDEDGRPLPPGNEGPLRVRTAELAFYVDSAGKALEMLDDGWFYPGDVGAIDANGAIRITGRSTEVINRGGIMVAPEIIEEVLRQDRRISDAAVVGVPNAAGIEEIWAAVVSDSLVDGQAVIDAVRPQLNEKVPDRVVQVNAIPRAESAKIKRGELREQLLARVRA